MRKNSEKISLGFVYFSAGATIVVLFLILGYILFNGFFYKNQVEYSTASYTALSFDGLVAVINREVGKTEVTFDILEGVFTDKYANWKKISDSSLDVYPYVSAQASESARRLFGKLGRLTEQHESASLVLQLVAGNKGGIGLVTAAEYAGFLEKSASADDAMAFISTSRRDIEKTIRPLHVRGIELACNSQVTALFGNFKIGSVQENSLDGLFGGKITNWRQLDGPDLPVTLVVPRDASFYATSTDEKSLHRLSDLLAKAELLPTVEFSAASEVAAQDFAGVVYVTDAAEFREVLANVPGAVGLLPAWESDESVSRLKLVRTERGLNLRPSFVMEAPVDGGRFGGISTIIANTFIMILLTLLFAVPPGLFAAIYLVEYAKEGRLLRILRLGTETLAGIPSIIFGLFGMLVFVQGFGWGICLLSGSLTLALMILPTIVRTAEEALKSVPHSLQEGSFALGGTKVQTLFRVVLPTAFPAISAGIILAIGRALGETAALIYTMGSNYGLTRGLFDSTRTLAVHLYLIIAEGISTDKAFASATVLVFLVFIINSTSKLLIKRIGAKGK